VETGVSRAPIIGRLERGQRVAKVHVVKPGDTLSSIAAENGFFNFRTVFDDPANAALKELRPNPHVLFPGDEVVIPDRQVRVVKRPTTELHTFVLQRQGLHLRLRIRDLDDVPLTAKTEIILSTNSPEDATPLRPDGKGVIEREIERRLVKGELRVEEKKTKMDLLVGGLDPITTMSGQRARLNNLGYFAGSSTEDKEQFRWAAEEFKKDKKVQPLAVKEADIDLEVGIAVGPFTQKLAKEHDDVVS
jgi:hypothetical protein